MAKNGHNRPAKMGRPTKYTEELVERFCEEIINGCSVHEICSRPDWPSEATIYNWLLKHEDFLEKYRIARELQADKLVDDLLPIADGERPTVIDGKPLDPIVQVRRDAERIKVRMWKAGRMSPRKWGDRIDDCNDLGAIVPSKIIIRNSADVRPGAAPKTDRGKEHDSE